MFPNTRQRVRPTTPGMRKRTRGAGFTITEIMIATGVSAFVMAGVLSFFTHFNKLGFINEQRNRINGDIRKFTAEMMNTGRQARYFVLYESNESGDRDDVSDRRMDGNAGDFLVFVFTDPESVVGGDGDILRLVGYFRDAEDGEAGPVRRFDVRYGSPRDESVENLLAEPGVFNEIDEVVELSKGLADGQLFFNFHGRSVMVNGQILHGNVAKRVTETYNFTVSTRG